MGTAGGEAKAGEAARVALGSRGRMRLTGVVSLDTWGRRTRGPPPSTGRLRGGLIIRFLRPREDLQHLTVAEAGVVAKLAAVMFPPGGAIAPGACDAEVVAYVDRFLGGMPQRERLLIRAMFTLFEVDFKLFDPDTSGGIRGASDEAVTRCLRGWETSRLYFRRVAFQALRSTLMLGYLGHAEVQRAIGVRGGEEELRRYRMRLAKHAPPASFETSEPAEAEAREA